MSALTSQNDEERSMSSTDIRKYDPATAVAHLDAGNEDWSVWCNAPGGELHELHIVDKIEETTCEACLHAIVDFGDQAHGRLRHLRKPEQ
jgi:hypothetical protein